MYNPQFELKADLQNHRFGWLRFESQIFKMLNNDDKKCIKN